MPKNFAFIRVVPITDFKRGQSRARSKTGRGWGVTGCAEHDLRFIFTPNADPKKASKNIIVCANTGWQPMRTSERNLAAIGILGPEFLTDMAKETIAEKGIKIQKNHVKVAALMMHVSPEYLRDGNLNNQINPEKVQTWIEGTVKFLRRKYCDQLLTIIFHQDEQNPHASAYLVPMIEKKIKTTGRSRKGTGDQPRESQLKWRLCHRDMFNRDKRIVEVNLTTGEKKLLRIEPGTCARLQDEYSESLKEVGLEVQRGIRKADDQKALEYETTKERYRKLTAPVKAIANLSDAELREWARDNAPVVAEVKRVRKERDHYQIAAGALQENAAGLKKTIADLKKTLADSVRDIPVSDAIRAVTGVEPTTPKAHGPDQPGQGSTTPAARKGTTIHLEFWLPNGQCLGVNTAQNRFENLTPHIPFKAEGALRRGAVGSINAVMYLTGCTSDSAIARLAHHFGNGAAKRAAALKIEAEMDQSKKIIETPVESRWAELLQKLKNWNLNEDTLTKEHMSGRINANADGHIVFHKQHFNAGNELIYTGNIVVDPEFPEINVVETGESGLFLSATNSATHNVICATPFDALAIKSLPEHQDAIVIAVGSNPNDDTKKTLQILIEEFPLATHFAENMTEKGRSIANWLVASFSERIKTLPLPKGFRHWLDYHLSTIKSLQKNAPLQPSPIQK